MVLKVVPMAELRFDLMTEPSRTAETIDKSSKEEDQITLPNHSQKPSPTPLTRPDTPFSASITPHPIRIANWTSIHADHGMRGVVGVSWEGAHPSSPAWNTTASSSPSTSSPTVSVCR